MQLTRLIKKRLEMKMTPKFYTRGLKTVATHSAEVAAAKPEAKGAVAEVVSVAGTNSAAEAAVADLTLEVLEVVYLLNIETKSIKAVTKVVTRMVTKAAFKVVINTSITARAEAVNIIKALVEVVEVIKVTVTAVVMATGNNNRTLANVNFKMVETTLTRTKFSESLLYVLTLYGFPPKLKVNTRSMAIVPRRDTSSPPHS